MSQYIRHDEDFYDSSSGSTDIDLPRPKVPNTSESLFFESLNDIQPELNDTTRPYSIYIDDTRLSQLMKVCDSSDNPTTASTDSDRVTTTESAYRTISPMESGGSSSIRLQQAYPNDESKHFSPAHESANSFVSNEIFNHSTDRPSHNIWAPGSVGTVSTSVLLNLNEETNDSTHVPRQSNGSTHSRQLDGTGVSSSFLPLKSFKLNPPNSASRTGCDDPTNPENEKTSSPYSSSSSYPYDDQAEPNIEEAVKLLKREVGIASPQVNYVQPNFGLEFKPHEYKLPRKISETSLAIETDFSENLGQRKIPKAPQSPSLLNNILVPSVADSNKGGIPALRAVSGNHKPLQSAPVKRRSVQSTGEFPGHSSTEEVLNVPQRARLARITKLTNSQIDIAVDTLREYRNESYNDVSDLEATAGRGINTFSDAMPIQHIDSSSVRSYDSQKNNFLDIYSIPRMICVLMCCLVIPPFFFMIAAGAKGGISNYRLMRMIMNVNHRVGLLKGFVWDIDVQWFRTVCLLLGSLETLSVLACIGVGFGVGLRDE